MNKSLFDYAEVCGFYQKMQNRRSVRSYHRFMFRR